MTIPLYGDTLLYTTRLRKQLDALLQDNRYWPYGLYFTTKGVGKFIADLARHVQPGQKSLDLGCGRRKPYKLFHESLGLEWYGADLYDQTNPPDANYKKVDSNRIDFADDYFDVICTYHVIEHFRDPEAMFAEISRCLKSNGVFCGACAFWEMEHVSFFHLTYRGISELLQRHGFEVISLEPSHFSGLILVGQRFFGGDGNIHGQSRLMLLKSLIVCNLNWIPFVLFCCLEGIRKSIFRPWNDPLKDCATIYFYARKRATTDS